MEPKMRDFAATPATHTSTASNIMNASPSKDTADASITTANNTSQATKPLMASAQNNNNESTEEPLLMQLPRSLLPHWGALMMCSALCLAAVAAGTPLTMSSSTAGDSGHYDDMQIVMAIATLSLMMTFVASACYLLIPAAFVGTLYEVTVVRTYRIGRSVQYCSPACFVNRSQKNCMTDAFSFPILQIGLNIVFWSGCLPIVMNPQNDLAVQGPAIVNGNLFVLSWLCFILSWVVLKHVLEQLYVMDQARGGNLAYLYPSRDGDGTYPPLIPMTRTRLAHLGLIFSSMIVLIASSRNYKQQVCNESSRQLCKRLEVMITMAVFSFIGLLVAWTTYFLWQRNNSVDVHRPASPTLRLFLTGMLTFGWFIATSLGTFGQHAPAHSVGNLFLSVWICFLLSIFLCKTTLLEYLRIQASRPANGTTTKSTRRSRRKNKKTLTPESKKKSKIPGLVEDDDVEEEEECSEAGAPVSTGTADDFEPTVTPLATPKGSVKQQTAPYRTSSDPTHNTIAMSLEESFEIEDQRRTLRQVPTEQTVEAGESFADEEEEDYIVDDASAQTARRGSSRRTKPTTQAPSIPSTRTTSIPYAGGEEIASHLHNNTTKDRADGDVLLDPEDFSASRR